MIDFRKVDSSPMQIRDDVTPNQIREAMEKRHKMIAAIFDTTAAQLLQEDITGDMMKQLGAAAELLNSEIDAMERILVEH
jgi:excinuclease UvrABC helicase subunit UvrB